MQFRHNSCSRPKEAHKEQSLGKYIQSDGIKEFENTTISEFEEISHAPAAVQDISGGLKPIVHIVENNDTVGEISCDNCEFRSKSKDEIRKHIENHNQSFQCE